MIFQKCQAKDWFKMPRILIKWKLHAVMDRCTIIRLHATPDEVADVQARSDVISRVCDWRELTQATQSKCEIWDNSASTSVPLTTSLCSNATRLMCPLILFWLSSKRTLLKMHAGIRGREKNEMKLMRTQPEAGESQIFLWSLTQLAACWGSRWNKYF